MQPIIFTIYAFKIYHDLSHLKNRFHVYTHLNSLRQQISSQSTLDDHIWSPFLFSHRGLSPLASIIKSKVWIVIFWNFCRNCTLVIWYMWDKKVIEIDVYKNVEIFWQPFPNKAYSPKQQHILEITIILLWSCFANLRHKA